MVKPAKHQPLRFRDVDPRANTLLSVPPAPIVPKMPDSGVQVPTDSGTHPIASVAPSAYPFNPTATRIGSSVEGVNPQTMARLDIVLKPLESDLYTLIVQEFNKIPPALRDDLIMELNQAIQQEKITNALEVNTFFNEYKSRKGIQDNSLTKVQEDGNLIRIFSKLEPTLRTILTTDQIVNIAEIFNGFLHQLHAKMSSYRVIISTRKIDELLSVIQFAEVNQGDYTAVFDKLRTTLHELITQEVEKADISSINTLYLDKILAKRGKTTDSVTITQIKSIIIDDIFTTFEEQYKPKTLYPPNILASEAIITDVSKATNATLAITDEEPPSDRTAPRISFHHAETMEVKAVVASETLQPPIVVVKGQPNSFPNNMETMASSATIPNGLNRQAYAFPDAHHMGFSLFSLLEYQRELELEYQKALNDVQVANRAAEETRNDFDYFLQEYEKMSGFQQQRVKKEYENYFKTHQEAVANLRRALDRLSKTREQKESFKSSQIATYSTNPLGTIKLSEIIGNTIGLCAATLAQQINGLSKEELERVLSSPKVSNLRTHEAITDYAQQELINTAQTYANSHPNPRLPEIDAKHKHEFENQKTTAINYLSIFAAWRLDKYEWFDHVSELKKLKEEITTRETGKNEAKKQRGEKALRPEALTSKIQEEFMQSVHEMFPDFRNATDIKNKLLLAGYALKDQDFDSSEKSNDLNLRRLLKQIIPSISHQEIDKIFSMLGIQTSTEKLPPLPSAKTKSSIEGRVKENKRRIQDSRKKVVEAVKTPQQNQSFSPKTSPWASYTKEKAQDEAKSQKGFWGRLKDSTKNVVNAISQAPKTLWNALKPW